MDTAVSPSALSTAPKSTSRTDLRTGSSISVFRASSSSVTAATVPPLAWSAKSVVEGDQGLLAYRVLNINEEPGRVQLPQPRAMGTPSYKFLHFDPDPARAVTMPTLGRAGEQHPEVIVRGLRRDRPKTSRTLP